MAELIERFAILDWGGEPLEDTGELCLEVWLAGYFGRRGTQNRRLLILYHRRWALDRMFLNPRRGMPPGDLPLPPELGLAGENGDEVEGATFSQVWLGGGVWFDGRLCVVKYIRYASWL